jgi:hypothetical protein
VEGITGKDNINKYLEECISNFQVEIGKFTQELDKSNIKSKEFNKLVDELDYRVDINH